MVVCHNHVVHAIHLFSPIKPTIMGWIVLRFMDFDEGPINRSNAALKLWNLCCQNLSLLNSGLVNLIHNNIIDVRCNRYAIIIYYTFAPITHEGTILSHIIMFHEWDEIKQTLFLGQLSHPKVRCGSFVNFSWLIIVNTSAKQFSFFHENY